MPACVLKYVLLSPNETWKFQPSTEIAERVLGGFMLFFKNHSASELCSSD